MFYSLAHKDQDFYKDSLYKAVMLAPCMLTKKIDDPLAITATNRNLMTYQEKADVYALYGPNWKTVEYPAICDNYSRLVCNTYNPDSRSQG